MKINKLSMMIAMTTITAVWLLSACSRMGEHSHTVAKSTSQRASQPTLHQPTSTMQQKVATQVYVDGNTVVYTGYLTADANQRVSQLAQQTQVDRLAISSRGGDVMLGMDLANTVFDNGWDVEVLSHCFSSCANYVFTAGRHKILHADSQLAWHGGVTQKMDFAGDTNLKAQYEAYIQQASDKERRFFDKINVSQNITTYGQQPQFQPYQGCIGWRYTLDKLATFGVNQVQLADKVWKPSDQFAGKCIFLIE